ISDGLSGGRGAHLNGGQEIAGLDDRAAVEKDEFHAERAGDRACQDRLAAALGTIEQNIEPAFQQNLKLLADQRIEIHAFELEFFLLDELDLDGPSVLALAFANGGDADRGD